MDSLLNLQDCNSIQLKHRHTRLSTKHITNGTVVKIANDSFTNAYLYNKYCSIAFITIARYKSIRIVFNNNYWRVKDCKCCRGKRGKRGCRGQQGIQGQPGSVGPQGSVGVQGSVGPQGSIGIPGVPGADGAQGLPGEQGIPGVPGADGAQGLPGEQGIPGVPGADGAQGLPGEQGIPGVPGEQGIPGVPGEQGIQGLPGEQGIPGVPGEQGIPGVPGEQGIQGLPGEQGIQGVPGEQGIPGVPGADGAQGIEGPQGPPGDPASTPSVYIYNTNSFTVNQISAIQFSDIAYNTGTSYYTVNLSPSSNVVLTVAGVYSIEFSVIHPGPTGSIMIYVTNSVGTGILRAASPVFGSPCQVQNSCIASLPAGSKITILNSDVPFTSPSMSTLLPVSPILNATLKIIKIG